MARWAVIGFTVSAMMLAGVTYVTLVLALQNTERLLERGVAVDGVITGGHFEQAKRERYYMVDYHYEVPKSPNQARHLEAGTFSIPEQYADTARAGLLLQLKYLPDKPYISAPAFDLQRDVVEKKRSDIWLTLAGAGGLFLLVAAFPIGIACAYRRQARFLRHGRAAMAEVVAERPYTVKGVPMTTITVRYRDGQGRGWRGRHNTRPPAPASALILFLPDKPHRSLLYENLFAQIVPETSRTKR